MRTLSIIVPVLDEEAVIGDALSALAPLRQESVEILVVDGGSTDRTRDLAAPLADRIIVASRGRARQMNAGAKHALGDVLVFLHADTRLPAHAARLIRDGLARSGRVWGRFDVRIAGRHPLLRVIALFMNLRSRLTGIATGDQAIFATRDAFAAAGGFPDIPLMEDVTLSARLKRLGRPLCLSARVVTSGRRWEARGVLRTMLLMWRLRLAHYFGAEPARLARRYGYAPHDS
jgi:rSAM/selenodomain-associated transferase 2